MFAKLFEDSAVGQILVMIERDEDCNPSVKFAIELPKLGLASTSFVFEDSDDGWEKTSEAFDKVDEELAVKMARNIPGCLGELMSLGVAG